MQLTQSIFLKKNNKNKDIFSYFNDKFINSRKLYNKALYMKRMSFKAKVYNPNYNSLNFVLKDSDYYKSLKAQSSQQLLKLVEKDFLSFTNSLKEYCKDKNKFLGKPKMPNYKKDKFHIIYTNQCSKIKDNKIYFDKKFFIKIPKRNKIQITKYQQIRVLYINSFTIKIEIIYNTENNNISKIKDQNILAIDLGINNFASCFIEKDQSFILNGKYLKSINNYFNYKISKEKSKISKFKLKTSNKIKRLNLKRDNIIKDHMHKASKCIVKKVKELKISKVIIGHNERQKQKINIGKKNNRVFSSIPYMNFINLLKYKLKLIGVELKDTQEAYSSKLDSLIFENINKRKNFLGKRLKRGLFQSSLKKLINADINGAINIARISGEAVTLPTINGFLYNPMIINHKEFCI